MASLASGDDDFHLPYAASHVSASTPINKDLAAVIRVITFDIPLRKFCIFPVKSSIWLIYQRSHPRHRPAGCVEIHDPRLHDRLYQPHTRKSYYHTEDPLNIFTATIRASSQREIYTDTESYVTALKASLRQSPDVIPSLGEMRDYETMDIAMTAAETGHPLFPRFIPRRRQFHRTHHRCLSGESAAAGRHPARPRIARAVISQQLVPSIDGTLIPAFEVMTVNPAISTMIRDNKIHQIDGVIATSASGRHDFHGSEPSEPLCKGPDYQRCRSRTFL